jgi:hypothetical protein
MYAFMTIFDVETQWMYFGKIVDNPEINISYVSDHFF